MAKYIDQSAAIARLTHIEVTKPAATMTDAKRALADMFPADVAEVVRCKDCKHYRNHPNGLCYLHTEPKENARGHSGNAVCVEPDDFCSYGERKEDAT